MEKIINNISWNIIKRDNKLLFLFLYLQLKFGKKKVIKKPIETCKFYVMRYGREKNSKFVDRWAEIRYSLIKLVS